jgi:hypothetical protein
MSEFTPGPWRVVTDHEAAAEDLFEIADVDRFRVVRATDDDGYANAGSPEADAALIAKAPLMHELLKHARCPHDGCRDNTLPNGDECQWCSERAAALSKASHD